MGMVARIPRYTVSDLERFPNDGNRYELLDGLLLVTPAPNFAHERIISRVAGTLSNAVQRPGHALVLTHGAVRLLPGTQLEPDILVVPDRFPADTRWEAITGHWLAVEVLSRSSRVYDREFKRDAYLDLGVQEVWLFDRRDRSVEVTRSRGETHTVRDAIAWSVPTLDMQVVIDLNAVFGDPRETAQTS
jgi:Uma2 family endonuclease